MLVMCRILGGTTFLVSSASTVGKGPHNRPEKCRNGLGGAGGVGLGGLCWCLGWNLGGDRESVACVGLGGGVLALVG